MARKKKGQQHPQEPIMPRVCDFGTEEFARHAQLVKEHIDQFTVRAKNVNNIWPLDRYLSRDTITEAQYRAGKRIYQDYVYGNVGSHYGTTWFDPSKSFDSIYKELHLTEKQAEAMSQFRAAYRALNHRGADIVWWVVCNETDMTAYEKAMGWRVGYGMIRLREALDDLAWYYRKI